MQILIARLQGRAFEVVCTRIFVNAIHEGGSVATAIRWFSTASKRTRTAPGLAEQRFQRWPVEQMNVLRIVVCLRRHRHDDKAAGDTHRLGQRCAASGMCSSTSRNVTTSIILSANARRVASIRAARQAFDATGPNSVQIGDALRFLVDGQHRQVRQRVDQRPEKLAATTAHIEQISGAKAAQDAEYPAHSRQAIGAL